MNRPVRNARLAAQQSITLQAAPSDTEAEGEDDDSPPRARRSRVLPFPPRPVANESEVKQETYTYDGHENGGLEETGSAPHTRSGRTTRPPRRFSGEEEFRASGSVEQSPPVRIKSSRSRKRVVDPDDDDHEEDGEADYNPSAQRKTRASHASAPEAEHRQNGTGRGILKRSRRTSEKRERRHDSKETDSFAPTESVATESDSDDPLGDMNEPSSDAEEEAYPPRRATRASTQNTNRRSTRNAARFQVEDEDFSESRPARTLRERKTQPNYAMPPLDISAELQSAEVLTGPQGPQTPGRNRRGLGAAARFMSAAGGLLPGLGGPRGGMGMTMGDPDSSDSVSLYMSRGTQR
jgi:hypothetical protein